MKKITLELFTLFLAITLFSCGKQKKISKPDVNLCDNVISWNKIEGATTYKVKINGKVVVETEELSYEFIPTDVGLYSIIITATNGRESSDSAKILYVSSSMIIDSPFIIINGNTISWNEIENASSYDVYVNDELKANVINPSYEFDDTFKGTNKVYVKAISSNNLYVNSTKSNIIYYNVSNSFLDAPIITINENIVSWDSVQGASSYNVYIDGKLIKNITETNYTVSISKVGEYKVTVVAVSSDVITSNSNYSNEVTYTKNQTLLQTPVISNIDDLVSWDAVPNATSYEVYVDGQLIETINDVLYEVVSTNGNHEVYVIATSSNSSYASSLSSNKLIINVKEKVLAAPVIKVLYDTVSWDAVAGANSYLVYVDSLEPVEVEETSYIVSTSSSIKVVAKNGTIKSSDSNTVNVSIKGFETSSEVVAGETFTEKIVLANEEIAKVHIEDTNTEYVWLTFFVKATKEVTYRVLLSDEKNKVLIDWNKIGGQVIGKSYLNGPTTGETTIDYEYVSLRLDLLDVNFDGEYDLTFETKDTTGILSITGIKVTQMLSDKYSMKNNKQEFVFADNVKVGDFGILESDIGTTPYYYSNFVTYGIQKVYWGNWLTFSYSNLTATTDHYNYNDDNKYQAMTRYLQFADLGNANNYQIKFLYGNDGRESHMLWKFTAYDHTTKQTYILKDWFVWASPLTGENYITFDFDKDASKAISGKTVLFTIQCQTQSGEIGNANRLFIHDAEITTYVNPKSSEPWTVAEGANGSIWNSTEVVKIGSETMIGRLVLKGNENSAILSTKIDSSITSNGYIIFYAKAALSSSVGVSPSTMMKLSMTINGHTYVLIDWYKLGGTSCLINKNNASGNPNQIIMNDSYELFMISLDNITFDYAGKDVIFKLEQKDSLDGKEQELSIIGFDISRHDSIVSCSSTYQGMANWATNWNSYSPFGDYPIPGGWYRVCATNTDAYGYYGTSTTTSFENLKENDTLKFNFTYGNYGNYGSCLQKLITIDPETGKVYNLIDWEFLSYPGGGDMNYSRTIDKDIANALAGKTSVLLVWQFSNTKKIDSPSDNRLYFSQIGFVIE